MRRSQDNNRSGIPPVNKPTGGTKKVDLELAYGTHNANVKPKGKTVTPSSTRKSVGSNKTQPSIINSNSTKTRKSTSTLVNAAKASYNEKYGSLSSQKADLTGQNKPTISRQQISSTENKGRKAVTLQSTKQPSKNMSGSLKSSKVLPPEEEEYDDDFEEDYQSDFEEVESTDEEDLGHNDEFLQAKAAAAAMERESRKQRVGSSSKQGEEFSELDIELLDSKSVLEFEELEKQLEVEDEVEDDDEGESEDTSMTSDIEPDSNTKTTESGFFSKKNGTYDKLDRGDGLHSSTELSKNPSILNRESNGLNQQALISVMSSPIKTIELSNSNPNKPRFDFGLSKREADKEAKILRVNKLRGMIKLDRVYSELIHLEPSYEQYMFAFSGAPRIHVDVQAIGKQKEESVQTESLDLSNKWTQKPPTWSSNTENRDLTTVRQEALGVGTDDDGIPNSQAIKSEPEFDFLAKWEDLSKFISRASRKIFYVLESEKRLQLPSKKGSPAGGSEIKMNRGLAILNNLDMGCLNCEGDFVACSNGHSTDTTKKNTSKNIITVWSMKEPSIPILFLRAWGHVSSIKIYPFGHIIMSGNKDGSLSLWDMDEPAHHHTQYQDHVIRTPSVSTSCMNPSHFDPIVGIGVLPDVKNSSLILSLDKGGTLISWVCLRTREPLEDENCSHYKSAWSKIHLTIRHVINLCDSLNESLWVTAFTIWVDDDTTEFVISTMNGFAARGLLNEEKTVFQKYCESDCMEKDSGVVCFDLSLYFNILAVGCSDKACRLYEFSKRKRILEITLTAPPCSIKWSKLRTSVLYIALTDTVFIWDLLVSDMAPWKTITLTSPINGLEVYTTSHKEFTVSMSSNELKISSLAGELNPLTYHDHELMESFIALLVT